MNTPEEARLKQVFKNLREHDRRTAPDFLNTVSPAGRRAVTAERSRLRNRLSIAAMLLLAAGTIVLSRSHHSSKPPGRAQGSLAGWSSPTAFLLETPGKQFWSETPRLGYRGIYGLPGARKDRE